MREVIRRSVLAVAAIAAVLLAVTTLSHLYHSAAAASCDAACQVKTLGWQVLDRGPPLWFRNANGQSTIEVAAARPGRPSGADGVSWATTQLTGPKGGFGPLENCGGQLPTGAQRITLLTCSVPPAASVAREAGIFVVATHQGLQAIGVVTPAGVHASDLNINPLLALSNEKLGSGELARAARSTIAMLTGSDYYIARGAGASGPPIDAVYHLWNETLDWHKGMMDFGNDYVLFKNGEVWRDPGAGPRDIDPVKFKEARWGDCGTWQRKGAHIAITMNGSKEVLMGGDNFRRYEPAKAASQRVDGQWLWGYTAVAGKVEIPYNQITLHADGRFERFDYSRGMFDQAKNNPGHYRIEGYTINLDYDGGSKNSALFYWAGVGKHGRYVIFKINGVSWVGDLVG